MKITFELDTTNPADTAILDAVLQLQTEGIPKDTPTTAALKEEAAKAPAPKKPKAETAAAKKKRIAAEAKTAKAALKADAEQCAADLMDDGNAGEVTLDELKGVVKATIERTDIDQVKAVFKEYKAGKISDLATETYADVKAELEAL